MKYVKRFLGWIHLKEKLHNNNAVAPLVREGDIWWACIGENVGLEINGKSNLFSRPVVILRKLAHGFYFVIPTTTQKRVGTWYVSFRHGGKNVTACLQQARAMDFKRLSNKLGELDDTDFENIHTGFRELYCENTG